MSDEVKDYLQAMKDAFCGTGSPLAGGVKQIVGTTSGELSQQQKDDCEDQLRTSANTGAQDRVEIILDGAQSPSFDPSTLGEKFTPYDGTGRDTAERASDTCQIICDALDKECEDDHAPAARLTRRAQTAIVEFRESAGMTE